MFRHSIEVYADLEYIVQNKLYDQWTAGKLVERPLYRKEKGKQAKAHPTGRVWTDFYGHLSGFVHPKNSDTLVAMVNIEEEMGEDSPEKDVDMRLATFFLIYQWVAFYKFWMGSVVFPHYPKLDRWSSLESEMAAYQQREGLPSPAERRNYGKSNGRMR